MEAYRIASGSLKEQGERESLDLLVFCFGAQSQGSSRVRAQNLISILIPRQLSVSLKLQILLRRSFLF